MVGPDPGPVADQDEGRFLRCREPCREQSTRLAGHRPNSKRERRGAPLRGVLDSLPAIGPDVSEQLLKAERWDPPAADRSGRLSIPDVRPSLDEQPDIGGRASVDHPRGANLGLAIRTAILASIGRCGSRATRPRSGFAAQADGLAWSRPDRAVTGQRSSVGRGLGGRQQRQ